MEGKERRFAFVISGAHGMDHFLKRSFPPLIPVWAIVFGLPLWQLGTLLGARSFGSAIGQAPIGHLSDRYDRQRILPTGIALMGLCIIIFPLLPRIKLLTFQMTLIGTTLSGQFVGMLAVMLVVGFGSSTLHPIGYPLISQNVSEQHKGTVLGMWGSARSLGEGIAPAFIGGSLLLIKWEWILIIIGVIGLLYAVYLFVMLGTFETRPPEQISIEAETDNRRSVWEIDRRLYVYPILLIFVAFVLQLIATGGTTVFFPEFVTSEYGYSFSILGFAVTPESTASFYYSALLLTAGGIQIWTGKLINRYDSRYVLLGFLVVGAFMLAVLAVFTLSPLVLFVILLALLNARQQQYPSSDIRYCGCRGS